MGFVWFVGLRAWLPLLFAYSTLKCLVCCCRLHGGVLLGLCSWLFEVGVNCVWFSAVALVFVGLDGLICVVFWGCYS